MNTEITALLISKTLFITLLVALLPLCAITYYQYRLKLRRLEVERILNILNIVSEYREMHSHDISRLNFSISVMFAMMFSAIGLSVLFLSDELGFATRPSLILGGSMLKTADCGAQSSCFFYQSGALLVYGLGFMGAYIWGLQGILRRYALNDLLPMTFYKFGLRMITASILSLLLYHAVGGFEREFTARADTEGQSQVLPMTGNGLLMIAAFFIGMFPQRGIKWLSSRVSFLLVEKHPSENAAAGDDRGHHRARQTAAGRTGYRHLLRSRDSRFHPADTEIPVQFTRADRLDAAGKALRAFRRFRE
jgi:hypothetical protein